MTRQEIQARMARTFVESRMFAAQCGGGVMVEKVYRLNSDTFVTTSARYNVQGSFLSLDETRPTEVFLHRMDLGMVQVLAYSGIYDFYTMGIERKMVNDNAVLCLENPWKVIRG